MRGLVTTVIKSAGGWGDASNNLVLEGYLDDRAVCRREIGEGKYAAGIAVKADDTVLFADGDTYDATRITVESIDNMGNRMPFIQECVEVTLKGPQIDWAGSFSADRRELFFLGSDGWGNRQPEDFYRRYDREGGMYAGDNGRER